MKLAEHSDLIISQFVLAAQLARDAMGRYLINLREDQMNSDQRQLLKAYRALREAMEAANG